MNPYLITSRKFISLLNKAHLKGYQVRSDCIAIVDKTKRDVTLELAFESYAIPIKMETSLTRLRELENKRKEMERANLIAKKIRQAKDAVERASRTKIVGKLLGTMPVTEYEMALETYITTKYSLLND